MISRLIERWRDRPDKAWQPSGYRYTAEGFDPALRERSNERRQREDRIRKAAARVASSPATSADEGRLRVVNGGER